jgi:hypothetical protein
VEKTKKTYVQLLARIKELEDENLSLKTIVPSTSSDTLKATNLELFIK